MKKVVFGGVTILVLLIIIFTAVVIFSGYF